MKKMLRHITVLIFLFPILSNAQEVSLSQEFTARTQGEFTLIGEVNDTILLFEESNVDYSLHVLTKDLDYLIEKELFFEKQKIHFNAFIRGEDDFTIIYSYESRFQMHVNAARFDTRGNLKDSILLFREREYLDKGNFSYAISNDRSKLILLREVKFNTIECIAFDLENFKKIWHRSLVFEDYRINHDLYGLILTNGGRLVLAFEKFNHSFRRQKHFQEIVFISPSGQLENNHKIDFQGMVSNSFNMEEDEKNAELVVAGLYAPKSSSRSEGYYTYKLNTNGVTQGLELSSFTTDLLKSHSGKRKNPKKYIPDLYVKDLIVRNDGGLLMIAEMQKEMARESVRRRYIDYHYEDIIVLSLHPDGSLFWDDLIRKYQLSFDDQARYSSYFLFKTPSNLRLIFNDEIKSENTVSEYKMSPLGNGVRKSLLSTDLHHLKLLFEDAIQISSTSFIVPSLYNGKYRVIRLDY